VTDFMRANNLEALECIAAHAPDDCLHWKKRARDAAATTKLSIEDDSVLRHLLLPSGSPDD